MNTYVQNICVCATYVCVYIYYTDSPFTPTDWRKKVHLKQKNTFKPTPSLVSGPLLHPVCTKVKRDKTKIGRNRRKKALRLTPASTFGEM